MPRSTRDCIIIDVPAHYDHVIVRALKSHIETVKKARAATVSVLTEQDCSTEIIRAAAILRQLTE